MYVGIRADEDQRKAYVSTKPTITAVYPFKDAGSDAEGVLRLLADAGLGLSEYYEWRTRSGCYFCYFQRRAERVGLVERHSDLVRLAKEYEGTDPETGDRYTWNQRESLEELSRPERVQEIKEQHQRAMESEKRRRFNPLVEILAEVLQDESDDDPCFFCYT